MKHIKLFERFLSEDHNQYEIPFNRKDHEGVILDKPEHIQVLDAFIEFANKTKFKDKFESIGKYTQYLTDELREKMVRRIFSEQGMDSFESDENDKNYYYFKFFENYPISKFEYLYDEKWFEQEEIDFDEHGINSIDPVKDIEGILTEKGEKEFRKFRNEHIKEVENENGFIDSLKEAGKEGLKIYRAINLKGQYIYDQIVKNYSGTGYYWTFDENKPESYSGDSFGNTYILYGIVRLQDIDWEQTYYKNIYSLKEECEIEVKVDAIIKLENIYSVKAEKFLPFKEPLYLTS